jgi:hypothetical protein
MSPLRRAWLPATAVAALLTLGAIALNPFPSLSPAGQQAAPGPLPLPLQYVPADSAVFVSLEAAKAWDHPALTAIRKVDPKTFDELTAMAKMAFGLAPEDVKSAVLFMPKIELRNDGVGAIVTFRNGFDKEKVKKGVESLLAGERMTVNVVAVDDRTALVLMNLGDEYAKPQPAGKTGPLTAALQAAASGKYLVTFGATPGNFPEFFRSDDAPPDVRAFQPLFKATSLTATVEAGKTFEFNLLVKTTTAGQAVECEKAMNQVLNLARDGLGRALKETEEEAATKASLMETVTTFKAVVKAMTEAKFKTLGTETQLTASLPADLPFPGAYLGAKEKAQEGAVRSRSANNLKQIALAMHNYASASNNMPPAAVCDKTGKPLLSWRVLILPYIEQDNLYKEFKLDESWDSANNKKLLAKMPNVYAMPGLAKPGDTDTYYRVFYGKGAGFDLIASVPFPAGYTDGTSNTLMCVTAAKAVPWTKPDDLEFDPEKDMTALLGPIVHGHVQIAMFDGSVRTLTKIPKKETLNALITRSGGEVIPEDFE